MGHFDDLLAAEAGSEWDDYVPGTDATSVGRAPLVGRLRLPAAIVEVRGDVDPVVLGPYADLRLPDDRASDDADSGGPDSGDMGSVEALDVPAVALLVRADTDAGRADETSEGGRDETGPDGAAVDATSMTGALLELAAATDPTRVHLDAAVVELPGEGARGVVIVDPDRVRRHRLVRLLCGAGAALISADRAILTPGSRTVTGWSTPVLGGGPSGDEADVPPERPASTLGRGAAMTRCRTVVLVGPAATGDAADTVDGGSDGIVPRVAAVGGALERFGSDSCEVIDEVIRGSVVHEVAAVAAEDPTATAELLATPAVGPEPAAEELAPSVAEALVRTLDLLEDIGVEPLVIGPVVTETDGPHHTDADGSARTAAVRVGRIDLFVDADQVDAAVETLTAAGCSSVPTSTRVGGTVHTSLGAARPLYGLHDPASGVDLGLHVRLASGPFGELVRPAELFERSVPVRIVDRWCRALHPVDRFVLACVQLDQGEAADRDRHLREVLANAPRAEAVMAVALDTSDRWGATRLVLDAVRAVDAEHPGLAAWWVERARRRPSRRRPGRRRRR